MPLAAGAGKPVGRGAAANGPDAKTLHKSRSCAGSQRFFQAA